MNILYLVLLIIFVLWLMSRSEFFTEKKTPHDIDENELDIGEYTQIENVRVSNDVMEKIVIAVNKRVQEITGLCTYIVQTSEVRKFKHKTLGDEIYRCMFMVVKYGGFPYAFSLSADVRIMDDPHAVSWNDFNMQATLRTLGVSEPDLGDMTDVPNEFVDEKTGKVDTTKLIIAKYMSDVSKTNPVVVVISLRTQPLDVYKPADDKIFKTDMEIREFEDYSKIRDNELNYIRNTPIVEKQVASPEKMYGSAQF